MKTTRFFSLALLVGLVMPQAHSMLLRRTAAQPSSEAEQPYPFGARDSSPAAAWIGQNNQVESYFGTAARTAGDVNGDGYDDIVIGAYNYSNGQRGEGQAVAYYGSALGLGSSPNWTVESNQPYAALGIAVATAGDVNGDGYDDVIIGASGYSNGEAFEGRAYVYYGSVSGLSPTPNWITESDQADAEFGISVGTAGDVNHDGYADVIVGAYGYDNGQTDEGRAYVYYGSANGLSSTPNWIAESDQEGANFGFSVSAAGNVNADGYADVIVGAYGYDNGQTDEGRAYVYYGSAVGLSLAPDWMAESDQTDAKFGWSVSTAGHVNRDVYTEIIVGALAYDNGQPDEGRAFVYYGSASGPSLTPSWTAESNQAFAQFGSSVGTAEDVNGDHYDEVIVGADLYSHGQQYEGRAFAFFGSATGLSLTPNWTAESNQANAYLGDAVGTAGDIKGDGRADYLLGVPYYDSGQTDEGVAVVVYNGR